MTDIIIPEEYATFDFGFSAVDVMPTEPIQVPVLSDAEDKLTRILELLEGRDDPVLQEKIRKLEAIIIPLLNNLLKTADKDYIYWPNRKEIIEKQIQIVLGITRG